MRYIISILGILVVLFLAWLASSNRKKIKIKPVI
ncbi:Na+ dependent nucleoside transporter N-terminal domain-containing protein, partial [Bacillus sp. JJ1521]